MKPLSHFFTLLRRLALVLLFMGIASHALAAKTYSDNGDGTVTDPTTGLIWMRCAMGQALDNFGCGGTANSYTFDQANALTGTTAFADHNDWRVPNIRELQTIVDRSVSTPSINSVTTTSTVATTTTTTQAAIIHTLTLPIGWNLLGNGWNRKRLDPLFFKSPLTPLS